MRSLSAKRGNRIVVGGDDANGSWPTLAPPPRPGSAPRAERTAAPTFSVVIAAFQAADAISDALDSLRAQSVQPHETIVCDDGSTDDLDAALAPYLDEIALLRQPNGGEAAAKNAGARAASGDFVVYLDADDVFLPERLEALRDLATARPDLDVLTTDAYLEVDGTRIRRCYEDGFAFETADQRSAILDRNFIFGLAAVRRRVLSDVGGFDETLRFATDWDLWCRLILGGSAVGLVDVPLARYRLQPTSLSAQRARLLRGRCAVLEKAASHGDLTTAERCVVRAALRRERINALQAELRDAVLNDAAGALRPGLRLAAAQGVRPATRFRALAAAAAPARARRALLRRDRRHGVPGQAGVRFPFEG